LPEPISGLVAAAALGSIATKAVERAWDAGELWIKTYLGGHGETVRLRAQENTLEFLGDLAQRVKRIEERHAKAGTVDDLNDRLADPDFAATLQSALVAAARSSDQERHTVLADLVAGRLSAPEGSQRAISAAIAVDAVPRLLPKHLDLLGAVTVITALGPALEGEVKMGQLPVGETVTWLKGMLQNYDLESDIGQMDLYHLDSVGCISYTPSIGNALNGHLARLIGTSPSVRPALNAEPEYSQLEEMWTRRHLFGVQLLPPGLELGIAVHQLRTGTTINRG
jgi:hypothetical protein